MNQCEDLTALISGYLDGELTQSDRQRVEIHLESCDDCRRTYEETRELREQVGKLPAVEMSPQEWDRIMNNVTVRTTRGAGWLLYVGGLVVLIGYGVYAFAVDDSIDAVVKTSIAALVLGMVLLLLSVLRQRMIASKTDRYRDVQI